MRKLLIFSAAFLCAMSIAPAALAHLPYLERDNTEIIVNGPEISKAYYGWLSGRPIVYSINSKKTFLLYLGLLSPQSDNDRQDYSARIYKDGELFGTLDGADWIWLVSYEPFANDYYNKGPEYEAKVPAGNYRIEVYNSGNSGNYVLAVGKTEDLSLGQFIRTLVVLPGVKEEFFGKPAWQAYNNFIGLMALAMLAGFAIIAYFTVSIIRRWRLKKRLDNEYKNNR
jgi:hypothetical protein